VLEVIFDRVRGDIQSSPDLLVLQALREYKDVQFPVGQIGQPDMIGYMWRCNTGALTTARCCQLRRCL